MQMTESVGKSFVLKFNEDIKISSMFYSCPSEQSQLSFATTEQDNLKLTVFKIATGALLVITAACSNGAPIQLGQVPPAHVSAATPSSFGLANTLGASIDNRRIEESRSNMRYYGDGYREIPVSHMVTNSSNSDILRRESDFQEGDIMPKKTTFVFPSAQTKMALISSLLVLISIAGIIVFSYTGFAFGHPVLYVATLIMGLGWGGTSLVSIIEINKAIKG